MGGGGGGTAPRSRRRRSSFGVRSSPLHATADERFVEEDGNDADKEVEEEEEERVTPGEPVQDGRPRRNAAPPAWLRDYYCNAGLYELSPYCLYLLVILKITGDCGIIVFIICHVFSSYACLDI